MHSAAASNPLEAQQTILLTHLQLMTAFYNWKYRYFDQRIIFAFESLPYTIEVFVRGIGWMLLALSGSK